MIYQAITRYELFIRIGFFIGVFLIIAIWEALAPRRQPNFPRKTRWPNNLGLVFLNTITLRLIIPILAIGMAVLAQNSGWGLFNFIHYPYWFAVLVSVIVLDFVIYMQHVIFHVIPLFWRIHRMHHTDLDIDVTTGLRFHPIEILLSMIIKTGAVVLLGAPPLAVLIFEILLNATSMFNHGNIYLPLKLDKILRNFIVTPDMHRVHHSVLLRETNSNYGFNLSWWDRLLGTYIPQPTKGHLEMTIGLNIFRDPKYLRLDKLLIIPFKRKN